MNVVIDFALPNQSLQRVPFTKLPLSDKVRINVQVKKYQGEKEKKNICLAFEHPSTKSKSYLSNHYLYKESVLKSKIYSRRYIDSFVGLSA